MSLERFTRADLRTIILALLLGAVGVGVAIRYYPLAFPEASINFKVSRTEVEAQARSFLQQRGFDLSPYRQLILFRYDDNAKTYLERELGLEEANRLMASEINVWRWKVRFFKPPEKEELVVWLDPAGQLVGFEHIVEEKAPGARLEKAQAQALAEIFLQSRMGLNLGEHTLVEDTAEERPNRLDYRFTWERKNFKAKDATYRIPVSVYGDQVSRLLPFLKIPEDWLRDYQRLRSRNTNLSFGASLFFVPLLIAILVVLVPRVRQRRVAWKPLLWLGGAVGTVFAVSLINSIPLQSESFPTATSYSVFVIGTILISLIAGVVTGLYIIVLASSGDAVYREALPDKVSVPALFTLPGLRTKEFFVSTLVGYALAAVQIGLVVIFYIVARHFGAWSPAEVKYDNFLSTALPWIYPLTVGLSATTTEEFAFRLFAIPFLKKYLKSTWLAVLIPAFVWGFLHSTYPQQPAWIRGVEVGIVGVILGFVFLRFGILATLVAHYTYNAAVISLLLLRSESFYFLLAGGLVMDAVLIPLAIAGVLYWQHRRFAAEPEIYNAALPAPAPAIETVPRAPEREAPVQPPGVPVLAVYAPLAAKKLAVVVAAGAVGLALYAFLPVTEPLSFLKWQTSPADAEKTGDAYLQGKGISPAGWRRATNLETHFQTGTAEYVRRQVGVEKINELWSKHLDRSTAAWRVRYFRPLEKEEHRINIGADGRVDRYDHLLEEKAAGANLAQAEGRQRAIDYVAKTYGVEVGNWKLVESKLDKRELRTDHHFIWEDPKESLPQAYVRAEVDVRGDEVVGYRPYLKVPEEWLRDLNRPRIQQLAGALGIVLLVILLLVLAVRAMPQHTFRWRLYLNFALLAGGASLISQLNNLRSFGYGYDTSVSWGSYLFQQIGSMALTLVGAVVLAVLLVLAVDLYYFSRSQERPIIPERNSLLGPYVRDAAVLGIAGALLGRGLALANTYLENLLPLLRPGTSVSFPVFLSSYLPGVSSGIGVALDTLSGLAILFIAIGVLRTYFRSSAARAAVVGGIAALFAMTPAIDATGFFVQWGFLLLVAAIIAIAIRYFFCYNALAYLIAFALYTLLPRVTYLWDQPAWRLSGVASAIVAAVLFLGLFYPLLRKLTAPADSGLETP